MTYLLDLEDITRNNHGRFDFGQFSITKDNGLKSQGLFQFVDD